MPKQEIKKKIEKLRKLINYYRYLYHVLDRQEISEAASDSLKNEENRVNSIFQSFRLMQRQVLY